MKKILLSTALVVTTAGVAAADVTLTGDGRFGLNYNGAAAVGATKTTLANRLRFNIIGSVETESGVTFGGQFRIRYDNGDALGGAAANAAKMFAEYNGMRLEVGNVDTAYDSAALMYDPELGFQDRSFGDPNGTFFAYNQKPNIIAGVGANYTGVAFTYGMDAFNVRFSAVDPDQTAKATAATKTEIGLSGDYSTGQFTVSAAVVQNGAGIDGNDQFFLGAAYAFSDAGNVGLNYIDEGDLNGAAAGDEGRTVTLYGNYSFGATTLKAYVANNDHPANNAVGRTKTALGLGVDYDLGGATLAAGVERGYNKKTRADVGVKFKF